MEENVETTKLTQLMRINMGATDEQIRSITDLASAQQKLGVIGDEIQLSGAQELSTYLTKTSNLKKLIPAMNDMLAQQYGLNASQEQAVTVAQMMVRFWMVRLEHCQDMVIVSMRRRKRY
jgi:hypothetical protein